MGVSNKYLEPFYKREIIDRPAPVALLGFTDNNWWDGDLYDLSLGNWDINDDWKLPKEYSTIICTRCAYFSKDPYVFIKKCWNSLADGGKLYVDWGLGDHWRFDNYKVGWIRSGEHESAYGKDNYLWSMVWDDEFLDHPECKKFAEAIVPYGYDDLKKAVYDEVPEILRLGFVKTHFDIEYSILSLPSPHAQMYVLLKGTKRQ